MFPPWVRLALYVSAAVAGVWLLFRWWQSARRSRLSRRVLPSRSHARTAAVRTPVTEAAPAATTAAPLSTPSITEQLTILKPSAALTPVSALSQVSAAVPASGVPAAAIMTLTSSAETDGDWKPPRWADRPLLSPARQDQDGLPRLRAEDVPVTRADDYVFGSVTPDLAAFLPESQGRFEESRKELQSAGYYQPHALQNFAAIRYLCIMLGLVLAGVLLVAAPPRWEWIAVVGLLLLPLLGWALPRLYVRGQAAERRSEIERGIPDLLDMLNMCVSQGLTIPDALRRILPDLREPYPALAQELRIVNEQASIGSMRTALENFSSRADIPEVHSFASLLTQTEKMGTSISEALTSYSDTMRESLKQRAEERGNQATFQILFPTVLCLMPAVYLFLLGPAIIELSNFFSAGGRDSLDQGTAVIQRINESRNVPGPLDGNR